MQKYFLNNMDDEQLQNFKAEIKSHLEDVLQAKVNGKIDRIQANLTSSNIILNGFISRAEPMVKAFENLTWFKKSIVGLITFLSVIAGIIIGIVEVYKLFTK